jgi:hypothetical protein
MPAALPGDSFLNNAGNPNLGACVIFDIMSGPKGSPLDHITFGAWDPVTRIPAHVASEGVQTLSTGAMSTGIGISSEVIAAINPSTDPQTAPGAIFAAGFNDNQIPGEAPTYAAGGPPPVVSANTVDSTRLYIGGGRSDAAGAVPGVPFPPKPYTTGVQICSAGRGGSRDGGTLGSGFGLQMVTATADVAVGAAVETGFVNRSTRTIVSGESVFGSSTAETAAVS